MLQTRIKASAFGAEEARLRDHGFESHRARIQQARIAFPAMGAQLTRGVGAFSQLENSILLLNRLEAHHEGKT